DHRRKGALKRDIESLRERNGALGIIVAALRTACELEASDILHQLRDDEDLEVIAKSIGHTAKLTSVSDSRSFEGDLSNLLGKPGTVPTGETRHFGLTSLLSFAPEGDDVPQRAHTPTKSWTSVTQDAELVGHLMGLYFCWLHLFYTLFSRECFLHDMACGRTKYCSTLLFNSLLAFACSYTDRPIVRSDRLDADTAGDYFFAEARRLLNEDDRSTMTTVQALAIMALREASCGRASSGFHYSGRCLRMALDLGLHLSSDPRISQLSTTEMEVRKITFWGCFVFDTAWSFCVCKIPQIPRAAITIQQPTIVEPLENKPWKPYIDQDGSDQDNLEQPCHTHRFMQKFSALTEIVNDTLYMFYAPRERFTSKRLLGFYGRYTRWFQALPECLQLKDKPSAQLLCLHMYHHTVVLQLFRPFLKADLLDSNVRPRDICTQSAEGISSLLNTYRELYGLRCSCPIIMHIVMTASTIHLLNLPSPSASASLAQGISDLRVMSTNHSFARRCLRIIKTLGVKWEIELPETVQEASIAARAETLPPSPISLGATLCSSSSTDSKRTPIQCRQSMTDMHLPFADLRPVSVQPTTEDLLWSPFPDQIMPMPTSPPDANGGMEITSMLDLTSCDWDQYSHDGFRMVKGKDPILWQDNMVDPWATV
ncbi:MAG: hypothetical protein M1812_005584, partial [Candelaria pacifica]